MKSSPKQLANLDRDGDGKPGGSLPHAAAAGNQETAFASPTQEPPADPQAPGGAGAAPPAEGGEAAADDHGDPGADTADVSTAAAGSAEVAAAEEEPEGDPAAEVVSEQEALRDTVTEFAGDPLADPPSPPPATQAQPELAETDVVCLRDMASNRYGLYRRLNPPGGYSSDPAGGGLVWPLETVDQLVGLGLAYFEPSGGQGGSVKVTPEGRAFLAQRRAA